ncbi:hypothetical protein AYI69_g8479, partial [Smittium culicis]
MFSPNFLCRFSSSITTGNWFNGT